MHPGVICCTQNARDTVSWRLVLPLQYWLYQPQFTGFAWLKNPWILTHFNPTHSIFEKFSVVKASVVECRSIPSIYWYFWSILLSWHSIDTSVESWFGVGTSLWVGRNLSKTWPTIDWLLNKCWSTVGQGLIRMSIWVSVEMSIKGINQEYQLTLDCAFL